jgi:hypothetical protein
LFAEQTACDFHSMIESLVFPYSIQGNCSAGLGISSREYQALNPSLNQRSHAHQTRFERYVERPTDTVVAEGLRGTP